MRFIVLLVATVMATPASAAVSNWIDFENREGSIAIPIEIDGQDATAILDTGAETNAISLSFLERNPTVGDKGRRVRVSGVFGSKDTHFVNNLPIRLFGVPLEVSQLPPVSLGDIDFLIGLTFFQNLIVQIDYPNSRIRIMSRDALDLKKIANVKMKRMSGSEQPVVKADINGEFTPWLALDTGNNGGLLLTRSRAEKRGWLEKLQTVKTIDTGVTTTIETETFVLPEFTIGPYTLENVIATVPGAGEDSWIAVSPRKERSTGWRLQSFNKKKSDGILGYDVLKHFVVTIDYKRSLLHIAEPELVIETGGGADGQL